MKELLFSVTKKDLRIDTFRAGGKGGQNQNKRNSGVRITHLPSGAVGEGRDERTYEMNKKNAYRRLIESSKFQIWLRIETAKYVDNLERQSTKDVIRTYSFTRNRVKDHRTGNESSLKDTLDGKIGHHPSP